MIEETPIQADKNSPSNVLDTNESGFIPMMLALLALVFFVIIFVYLRVLKARQ